MPQKIDWDEQLGRRLKLRDLHVFLTAVERGSMAKAANHLGVTQPVITDTIAKLERLIGVRLLDRSRRGVVPTNFGHLLVKGGAAAFDALKQSMREVDFLVDPTAGELQLGCPESLATSVIPPIIERFVAQYPHVAMHVKYVVSPDRALPELRGRQLDLVLDRLVKPLGLDDDDGDLNIETLFEDDMVIAAGTHTKWAQRRKIDLTELAGAPWILTPEDSWYYQVTADAFRSRGLDVPKVYLMTFSAYLRANLMKNRPYISAFPASFVRINGDQLALKTLPIDLPARPWPVLAITLKHRTLSPLVARFLEHARAFTRGLSPKLKTVRKSS